MDNNIPPKNPKKLNSDFIVKASLKNLVTVNLRQPGHDEGFKSTTGLPTSPLRVLRGTSPARGTGGETICLYLLFRLVRHLVPPYSFRQAQGKPARLFLKKPRWSTAVLGGDFYLLRKLY
jgi:hypothetical protein